jgi:hypothetical protein
LLPCAALVRDTHAVVENSAYWSAVHDEEEGHYLVVILNSEAARLRVESQQAKGQWGARHFHKVMFNLPIPRFDGKNALHAEMAATGWEAERTASEVSIPDDLHFQTARRRVREVLAQAGIDERIDDLVNGLLAN